MTTDTSEKTIQRLMIDDEIPEINGCPEWVVIEFIDNIGVKYFDDLTDVERQLEDAYQGIYKSEKEFSEKEFGVVSERLTRDLFMGDFYSLEHPSRTDPVLWKRYYDIAVFRNL